MTPVEELFQLLWDTPQDKLTWFAIKKRMLEKEKEVIMDAFQEGKWDGWQNHKLKVNDKESQWTDPAEYYNETFNTKEK